MANGIPGMGFDLNALLSEALTGPAAPQAPVVDAADLGPLERLRQAIANEAGSPALLDVPDPVSGRQRIVAALADAFSAARRSGQPVGAGQELRRRRERREAIQAANVREKQRFEQDKQRRLGQVDLEIAKKQLSDEERAEERAAQERQREQELEREDFLFERRQATDLDKLVLAQGGNPQGMDTFSKREFVANKVAETRRLERRQIEADLERKETDAKTREANREAGAFLASQFTPELTDRMNEAFRKNGQAGLEAFIRAEVKQFRRGVGAFTRDSALADSLVDEFRSELALDALEFAGRAERPAGARATGEGIRTAASDVTSLQQAGVNPAIALLLGSGLREGGAGVGTLSSVTEFLQGLLGDNALQSSGQPAAPLRGRQFGAQ